MELAYMLINRWIIKENVIFFKKNLTVSCETIPIFLSYWRKTEDMHIYTLLPSFSYTYIHIYEVCVSLCICVYMCVWMSVCVHVYCMYTCVDVGWGKKSQVQGLPGLPSELKASMGISVILCLTKRPTKRV